MVQDFLTGANLGVVISDPALNTTNLALGPSGFWFVDGQRDLYLISLTFGGLAVPVLEDLDISGVDGLTVVHPEPFIVTEALPPGVLDVPYGPLTLEAGGGGPGIQWVALSGGYQETNLGENGWQLVGQGQGLFGDDVVLAYGLPFLFPYYGESYATVWICNNGFLDFDGPFTDPNNSDAALIASKRICPLWDNLRTDFGGRDVFVDESVPGQVTIRWDALQNANFGVCNFSCTLFASGAIEFHYGIPNENITPTVGISSGDGVQFILSQYNGQSDLGGAASLRFQPSGGLPEGVVLSPDGVLAGTPLETGLFTPTIRLTDALGGFDEQDLPLEVFETLPCPADLSGDGQVDSADLALLLGAWGPNPGHPADLNGDDMVDGTDLALLLGTWGSCP